jgi:RNA polymerase sigma-70 factor, ECF subfamily
VGADRIVRLVISLREKFWAANRRFQTGSVNGETALLLLDGDRLVATLSIATDGTRIHAVYAVVNPDKLS